MIDGYFDASWRVVTFGFVVLTTGVIVRSPLGVRSACSTWERNLACATLTPLWAATFLIEVDEYEMLASWAGRFTPDSTRFTNRSTVVWEKLSSTGTSAFTLPPARERAAREMMFPS